MTERTLTTGLVDTLRVMYPRAVILKHSDRFTSGIPDLSISVDGVTVWLEIKFVRVGKSLRDEVKPIQRLLCTLLQRATGGRCWILAYYEEPRAVRLVAPSALSVKGAEPIATHSATGYNHSIVQKVLSV